MIDEHDDISDERKIISLRVLCNIFVWLRDFNQWK
jgi:hypothetical protein